MAVTKQKGDIAEAFVTYLLKQNKVYFIPLSKIKNRSVLKLRIKPAKNKQKKFIVMAAKYESRFDLLEK